MNGADPSSLDKTRTVIRNLDTQIKVSIHSVESISRRIETLRDEELQPQLLELVQGYVSDIPVTKVLQLYLYLSTHSNATIMYIKHIYKKIFIWKNLKMFFNSRIRYYQRKKKKLVELLKTGYLVKQIVTIIDHYYQFLSKRQSNNKRAPPIWFLVALHCLLELFAILIRYIFHIKFPKYQIFQKDLKSLEFLAHLELQRLFSVGFYWNLKDIPFSICFFHTIMIWS